MKKIVGFGCLVVAVLAGSAIGYKLATDEQLRNRILHGARDVYKTSKGRMSEMTEEVALKTAKMTRNPKINQDWVENQWEAIGL